MPASFQDVPITKVSDYWNSRPCNIAHSAQPVGSREYFDEVEVRKYFVEPHIPAFAEFDRWKGKRVLEIGCGIGTDTINFARGGADVTAVDLTEKSLDSSSPARRSFRCRGSRALHSRECRTAEPSRSGGTIRLGLFVRSDSSYPASGARAGRNPPLRHPAKHRENHGLQPMVVEGFVDPVRLRKRPFLEVEAAGGGLLGSGAGLPGDLLLFTQLAAAACLSSTASASPKSQWITFSPTAFPNTCSISTRRCGISAGCLERFFALSNARLAGTFA